MGLQLRTSRVSHALCNGMTRAILKQFGKRPHDNDLLTIQDRIGEIRLERYFRTLTGYVLIFSDLFLRDVIILSIM